MNKTNTFPMLKYLLSIIPTLLLLIPSSQAYSFSKGVIIVSKLDTIPEPGPSIEKEPVYKIVERMPVFTGCGDLEKEAERKACSEKKIITFINETVKYPEEAREKGKEGTAVVKFIIEKDGTLRFDEKVAILRDPGGGCGEEALRVIQSMPNWIPGEQRGKAVNVEFILPIKFKLSDEVTEFETATIKWDGYEIKGQYKAKDPSEYIKAECTLDKAKEILSAKTKGMPLMLKLAGNSTKGFTQYYFSVGKTGKKHLVNSASKNKALKQKALKALESGEIIYFYNWEYKKTFMEILMK